MTSPIATAGRKLSTAIQTRMVGSIERYLTWARAWPSLSSGTGDSTSCRSPGATRPFGRDCRRSWRLVIDTLERNIFVGDFGAAGGGTAAAATTVKILRGRGVAFHVVAAGARCAATTACGGAFDAATPPAAGTGDKFKAGGPLSFLVLPDERLAA